MGPHAVFPGSFDPVTVAHLAVADAVHAQTGADVDLVISEVALAKEHTTPAPVSERLEAIHRLRDRDRPWLSARSTSAQLLVDIADGYDFLVLGADKWHQLLDTGFYGGSPLARDEALARLPTVVVAPRSGVALPATGVGVEVQVLDVPEAIADVSATGVRAGRDDWRV